MAIFKLLTSHASRVRRKTEIRLEAYTRPSAHFFVLISLASILAVLGLILDNTAIVIGAMVVAPLITPIFGFSLGLIIGRAKRVGISLWTILLGSVCAVITATLISYLVIFIEGTATSMTNEMLTRTEPNLLFFLVALVSGMAGAYTYAKEELAERIAGIAISVAVIPPLAVIGIGIATQQWMIVKASTLLYCFNLAGICFGSIIMFIMLGFLKDKE